jgi:hypothetical protein
MSWVTDVPLCIALDERLDDDFQIQNTCGPIEALNGWLEEQDLGALDELSTHVVSGGKAMQSFVYGGAFNHMDLPAFREAVFSQPWVAPKRVQLLMKDEEEEVFSLFGPNVP